MILRGALLWWMLVPLAPVTLAGLFVSVPFVAFSREVLDRWQGTAMVFIGAHCFALTFILGRASSAAFGFLYTRGFSRDAIWCHRMLAAVVSVLAVWLPSTLLIWTGARSRLQDGWLQSPVFLIMSPREQMLPLEWLGAYLFATAVLQYAWIRGAQPTRGGTAGITICVAFLIASPQLLDPWHRRLPAVDWITAVAVLAIATAAFVGSWRMHRSVEVHA